MPSSLLWPTLNGRTPFFHLAPVKNVIKMTNVVQGKEEGTFTKTDIQIPSHQLAASPESFSLFSLILSH